MASPSFIFPERVSTNRNLDERRLAAVVTPGDENAALAPLPDDSKKRTHCGRPKEAKALLPAGRVFSEEPSAAVRRHVLGQAPLQNKANPSSAHRTKPRDGAAKRNRSERSAPGQSKKRTHCGDRRNKTKARCFPPAEYLGRTKRVHGADKTKPIRLRATGAARNKE